MKKSLEKRELSIKVRSGLRLNTPPPKQETPKNIYSRKNKHKRRFDTSSSFFLMIKGKMM